MGKADLNSSITPAGNTDFKTLKRNSLLRNFLVVIVCLSGMAGSLWLFRQDFNKSIAQLNEKPAGIVYWVNNDAQRLSPDRANWDRLHQFSPIFDGDIVSAAPFSETKIRFNNNETLELFENTQIQIFYRNTETAHFKLLKGEIQIQSDQAGLMISLTDAASGSMAAAVTPKVILDPNTSAAIKAGDSFTLRVYSGTTSLSSGSESRQAAAGEALIMGKTGVFSDEPSMTVLYPKNGTQILRTSLGKAPVKFQWQKANSAVILEIAKTKDFSQLVESWYGANLNSVEIGLPEGTYYWKAFLPPLVSEVDSGRLDIVYIPGSLALLPADGSTEKIWNGKTDIRFTWSVPEEAEAVLIEAADNPEMYHPKLRQLIRKTGGGTGSYVSSELKPGKWYWHVHPVYPGGVRENNFLFSSLGTGMSFWRVRPVNADINMEKLPSPVNSFTITKTSPPPAAEERKDSPVEHAEPGAIPRTFFPPDNYTLVVDRTPYLLFTWRDPHSYNARLQIAERSDFAGPLVVNKRVYGSNTRSPFLKEGVYYWRITTDPGNSGGNSSGKTASSSPIRLTVEPALAAPKLNSPVENERLHIQDGKPINFAWERMNYANYYLFRLFAEGRDIPLAEISSLQNNSVQVFFDIATAGRFRWTVQGFTSPTESTSTRSGLIAQGNFSVASTAGLTQDGRTSWTIPRIANIQTYQGDIRSPITLISPAPGTNIPGVQALRAPLEARWRTTEPLRNVQLLVSQTPTPSSDPKAIVMDAGSSSVNFPALSEGIWYWVIRGDTSDERGATAGDAFWFKVLPIPQLPSPVLIQPENQSIIDIAQLTRDRNITFKWEEVNGANAYIFSLFRENAQEGSSGPPTLITSSSPEAVLSYVLNNLSILNEGNYLWQAEAVYVNANGIIEQRGKIEQHPFTIEIKRSDNIQTQNQSTIYGH